MKTSDPEVFRLLGEVKYELKDYDGSAAAYKLSAAVTFCCSGFPSVCDPMQCMITFMHR